MHPFRPVGVALVSLYLAQGHSRKPARPAHPPTCAKSLVQPTTIDRTSAKCAD